MRPTLSTLATKDILRAEENRRTSYQIMSCRTGDSSNPVSEHEKSIGPISAEQSDKEPTVDSMAPESVHLLPEPHYSNSASQIAGQINS